VKAIMHDAGSALMGIGRASGESRAIEAAKHAIASPLLEINITGAQGILFNISGSSNLTLFEVTEAAEEIRAAADPEANIIFGTSFDERLGDEVTITVIATGFDQIRRREAVRPTGAGAAETPAVGPSARTERERTFLDELERQRTIGEAEEAAAVAAAAQPVSAPATTKSSSVRSSDGPSVRRSYDADDLEIPAFLRRKS